MKIEHKRKGWERAFLAGLACLCFGCSESYPGIMYEEPGDVVGDYVTSDSIPIMLTVKTPQLDYITRGYGPIDKESQWQKGQAELFVFAFQASNVAYPDEGAIDYTQADAVLVDGLLDTPAHSHGKRVKLDVTTDAGASEAVVWADGTSVYYNHEHQDYKYNFFIYHYDDAEIGEVKREKDRIHFNLTIDGTQDIFSGVARPSFSESEIKRLEGAGNQELLADFKPERGQYVYSTWLGHRGIHPNFNIKHELVRFHFAVQRGDEAAKDIKIHDVIMRNCRNKGTFTVAAKDTTEVGVDFSAYATDVRDFHLPDTIKHLDGSIEYTATDSRSLKSERYDIGSLPLKSQTADNTLRSMPIGADLMLAPQESYELLFVCSQVFNGEERTFHPSYTLSLPNQKMFEKGSLNNIYITVYGLQEITLQTSGIEWKKGVDITLDDEISESPIIE